MGDETGSHPPNVMTITKCILIFIWFGSPLFIPLHMITRSLVIS